MARRQKKLAPIYEKPHVPLGRGQYRDKKFVQSIVLRMGKPYVEQLDQLCNVNNRSRREIVEMLINQAAYTLSQNTSDRITPL